MNFKFFEFCLFAPLPTVTEVIILTIYFLPLLIFHIFPNFLICIDEWVMCDDDNITPVTSQEILKLSGGGKVTSSLLNQSLDLNVMAGNDLSVEIYIFLE